VLKGLQCVQVSAMLRDLSLLKLLQEFRIVYRVGHYVPRELAFCYLSLNEDKIGGNLSIMEFG
jgi:hypothetical protein